LPRVTRFAVLASGAGSNAAALATAVNSGRLSGELACVIADREQAPVVARLTGMGVEAFALPAAAFAQRDAYERVLLHELECRGVQVVVLAGYMRICGPRFLQRFGGRTLNVHPSLLPAFPGRDAIGDALLAGARRTGVTIHFIDAGVDSGPAICQAAVTIESGEGRTALATRIHLLEHQLLPVAVDGVLTGEIAVAGRTVLVSEEFRARLALAGGRCADGVQIANPVREAALT